MKYLVVTGSSGGIGRATVEKLINQGYFVFGIDYVQDDYQNEHFKFIKCNLLDQDSIANVKEEIINITNKIDGIMNLAGIFMLKSIVEGDEESLRRIIDINFFGTYRINKTLLELLNEGSKILIFSSEVARYSPQPFNGYYFLSKIIVDKYADVLRRELNYLNLKVIKVQSGAVKTRLLDGVNKQYQETVDQSKYYKKPLTKLKKLMDDEICKQTKPEVIAEGLVKIMNKKHPKICYHMKNSFKLSFLDALPEKLQDDIYIKVIK